MSYILDALKRAEKERKLGQAPAVLEEIAIPQPGLESGLRQRRRLIAIAALIALLAIGYGAFRLLRSPAPATPAPVLRSEPAPLPAGIAAPSAEAEPAPASKPAPAADEATAEDRAGEAEADGESRIQDGDRIASLDDLTDHSSRAPSPPVQERAEAAAPAEQSAPASDAGSDDDGAASIDLGTSDSAAAPSPPPPAPPAPVAATAAAPSPAPAAQADQKAYGDRLAALRRYKEMPPAYRADFPALVIDVHVYNADPQRSFVIVNGKHYRAGDTLAEGPRIDEIVPEGMVLDWRGEKVLYALSH